MLSSFGWICCSVQAGRVLRSKAALNLPLALRQEAETWHSRQEERLGHACADMRHHYAIFGYIDEIFNVVICSNTR